MSEDKIKINTMNRQDSRCHVVTEVQVEFYLVVYSYNIKYF